MQHLPVLASFVCIALSCVNEINASCPKRTSLNSYRTTDRKLRLHTIKGIPGALSPYQCADACLRDMRCQSFNYKRKKGSGDINECEMNDIRRNETKIGEVKVEHGWDLYDIDFEGLQEVSTLYMMVLTSSTDKIPKR